MGCIVLLMLDRALHGFYRFVLIFCCVLHAFYQFVDTCISFIGLLIFGCVLHGLYRSVDIWLCVA